MSIFCIGRNYVAHAQELGNEVPTSPVIFMKPSASLLADGKNFNIPSFTNDLHYEGELVLRVSKQGKNLKAEAQKQVDKLMAEAGNDPIKKLAARKAGEKVIQEADKQTNKLQAEANKQADALVNNAKVQADKIMLDAENKAKIQK